MLTGVLIALAAAAGVWLVAILVLILLGRKTQAREISDVLPNLAILFRGLGGDVRVPRTSKAWLGFALAWFVSPIDLVPEFIPVLGPLDDAVVAALVLRHVLRRADRSVLTEHRRGDPATQDWILRLARRKPRFRRSEP